MSAGPPDAQTAVCIQCLLHVRPFFREVLTREGLRPIPLLSLAVLLLLQLSALREVSLAREIHDAGVDDHRYLYLGSPLPSSDDQR